MNYDLDEQFLLTPQTAFHLLVISAALLEKDDYDLCEEITQDRDGMMESGFFRVFNRNSAKGHVPE